MIKLQVNGEEREVEADASTPLLYVLRDQLALNGAKFGCGLGQCGACTVLVDGAAVFSCITPISLLPGRAITTLEGLGTRDKPGPLQRAFIAEQDHEEGGNDTQRHDAAVAKLAPGTGTAIAPCGRWHKA